MNYAMNTVNYQHKTILIIQESDTWDEFWNHQKNQTNQKPSEFDIMG
jgi:hypothetical protein